MELAIGLGGQQLWLISLVDHQQPRASAAFSSRHSKSGTDGRWASRSQPDAKAEGHMALTDVHLLPASPVPSLACGVRSAAVAMRSRARW